MNQLTIHADRGKQAISRHIYGHFAEHLGRCVYGGLWVGEDSEIPNIRGIRKDVIEALRELNVPNLRWPGGCYADEYHWMDGIGPRESRPATVNGNWGVIENNHFGTHEFFDLCELIGAEAYISGNLGSGTVKEMADWIEYMTHPGQSSLAKLRRKNGREEPWEVSFFGVGNESWECGGNMVPEYYANEYRRYQTYVRQYGKRPIFKIACGASEDNYHWTQVLMKQAGPLLDGLSLHFYTILGSWQEKKSDLQFDEAEWFATLKRCLQMDELLRRHKAVMDAEDPAKRVGLMVDEWGTWWEAGTKGASQFPLQQNTMRDAMVAGLTLNIFNAHCDRVRMANIAQVVNVLQSMILTDGPRLLLTPTYHVFEMWKVHHDATLVPIHHQCDADPQLEDTVPRMSASASRDGNGNIHVTLCNTSPSNSLELAIKVQGAAPAAVQGRVLHADVLNAHNTFEEPRSVVPRSLDFDELRLGQAETAVRLPPASVAVIEMAMAG